MSGVTLISDIAWVKRGVAKQVPDKVKMDAEEFKNFFPVIPITFLILLYIFRHGAGTIGNAMYSSSFDDPYITNHVESDDEEREDFEIKPDDNLVAIAKINKGEYTIEAYVYNEGDDDWYVHHDYILDAPPLCLEHLSYDPGDQNRKGNLLAVGSMTPFVGIWDLDLVNAMEPVVLLGSSKGNRHKRDGSAQGHSDAVLSLSWNRNSEHVIASGSADQTVVLWDLDDAKAANIYADYGGKVQSLEWHPGEISILLSGTLSGDVCLRDCRQGTASPPRKWKVDGEVEQLFWDCFNPFYFYVATDSGKMYYIDSRAAQPHFVHATNDGEIHGISQSVNTKGLICTCGSDSMLKIWKNNETGMQLVHEEQMSLGELHSVRFSPDSSSVVAVGGSKDELVKVVSLEAYPLVKEAFSI
uniref:WD_REPEATS_REGION domain-containing protein n=1 Tax=Syphacia muris TaxID=451379 RepID=A0A0N5AMH2_9BILA